MEVIPDNEANRTTLEAALNNFDVLDVEVQEPDRVIYGFTPHGGAAYDVLTNQIFVSPEFANADNRIELATLEHEIIHYNQFRRLMDGAPEHLNEIVSEVEQRALSTAIEEFENSTFIDTLTHDQHLNYHNFQTMVGLATENNEFLDELHYLSQIAEDRKKHLDEDATEIERSPEEVSYAAAAETAEEIAENYWRQDIEEEEFDRFEPLITRYDPYIEDGLLEAQAQFWSMFTIGMLEELPEEEGVYTEPVESKLDTLEFYADNEFYDHGDYVEEETKRLLEQFRERKYSESKSDPEIAVEMLNNGLEYWNSVEPKFRSVNVDSV